MFLVFSAARDARPPLFMFRDNRLPFRNDVLNGEAHVQTYKTFLPHETCVSLRDKCDGINSASFYNWVLQFVASVCDLSAGGRHVLLT